MSGSASRRARTLQCRFVFGVADGSIYQSFAISLYICITKNEVAKVLNSEVVYTQQQYSASHKLLTGCN